MNSNLINNQGRFIETFDRELRAQINDYERRQAFEQQMSQEESDIEIKTLLTAGNAERKVIRLTPTSVTN